jgi:HAMP domain-containing protein
LRRLPIRTKLAVALAVPLLALIAVTVLEVVRTSTDVSDITEQTELAKAAIGPSGIITALQNERTWLAVELIGQQGSVEVPVEGYEETRAQTDEAIQAFRDDLAGRGDTVTEVFQEPLDGLDALQDLRGEIDASTAPRDPNNIEFAGQIFDRYTTLIEPFFSATTQISLAVDDATLRQGAELADVVAREIETMSLLLRTLIIDATLSEGGINEPSEITEIATLHSDFQHYAEVLRGPTGQYAQLAADYYPEDLVASVDEQIDAAVTTGRIDLATVLAAVNVPRDEAFTGYQDVLHAMVTDRADDLQTAAQNRRIWFGALALLALCVAVVLTWLVSRSITRPLRSLTRQAKQMAEHRLPDAVLDILETPLGDDVDVPQIEPVTVRTRDEVADVADALNTVQDSALDLAVEQAVLRRNIADSFVNLGRRNQNLLGRQLDFITELESNETDPDTLASLFRLDHLATRMRRNAESLLVLAGIDPPRKWAAPVRLTDVIRAALGEVEDYQRVAIRDIETTTIFGSAAADLAHLVAEFIENALTFSPPDENVDIQGRALPDGGGYALAIVDRGLGMPEADVAQANRRLAGTESFTIAPSKYLGHYVAGNLAARHGIHLELERNGTGITANVEIPPGLLTSETPADDPITDPHGHRPVPAHVPLADDQPQPALTMLWSTPQPSAPAAPAAASAPPSPAASAAPAVPAVPAAAGGAPNGIADALASLAESVAAGRADRQPPPATPGNGTSMPATGPAPGPAPGRPADAPRHRPAAAWVQTPGVADPPPATGPVRRVLPESEATRTASGLVKRTPLATPAAPPSAVPSDDLLAALGRHAQVSHDPAGDSRPGAASVPASARLDAVPAPAPSPSPSPVPSTPAAPSPSPAPASSPSPGPAMAPSPASSPSPAPSPAPAPEASPPAAAPADTGSTSGRPSLARRVRGSNMPDTDPLAVRRLQRASEPAPAQNPSSPDDVYGFLTNFTSGVQRGLDDSHGRDDSPRR